MGKIRVLLIDDHPAVRAGIRMMLEQDPNIEVVGEGDNGDRALQLVELLKPDVLLLDMEMPGKDGVEVAEELNRINANVRILGLSAYDDEQYISGLLSNGAAGYLTKEEALEKIVEAVHGVARGEKGWFSQRAVIQMAAQMRKEKEDLYNLTPREEEVGRALVRGLTNKQIALELGISERTVRFHLSNLYDKLDINSRAQAIVWALKHDFV